MTSPSDGSGASRRFTIARLPLLDTRGVWEYALRTQEQPVLHRLMRAKHEAEARISEPPRFAILGRDEYEALCAEMWSPGVSVNVLLQRIAGLELVVVDVPGLIAVALSADREFATKIKRPREAPEPRSGEAS